MTIFIHGKMKRIGRSPQIGGVNVDEFIRRNAGPMWLHHNEMWKYIGQGNQTPKPELCRSRAEGDEEPLYSDLNVTGVAGMLRNDRPIWCEKRK